MVYNKGKIIKNISNLYTVQVANKLYECKPRGKFRYDKITPTVGDYCVVDTDNNYIMEILPRINNLTRPVVANVDAAVIVTSLKEPDLSMNLLDKLIMIITIKKIEPIICLTKLDLLNIDEINKINEIIEYYKSIGIKVVNNQNIDEIKDILKNKTVVFTGQSGAGKSTLINKLDTNLNLETNEISKALGRGKHTTRHVELYKIADFFVVDTPGFSSIDFEEILKADVKNGFIEFKKYECKFNDCNHYKEINCGVKDAVNNGYILSSRYESYIDFYNEAKESLWK
ncbi:MAG: ribosome small subunit-dependent GTPase A [Bacilli bacterium]|nr:ribosome small subunit-dependent GTPase A [Bacilli bacterium]